MVAMVRRRPNRSASTVHRTFMSAEPAKAAVRTIPTWNGLSPSCCR